MDSLLLSATKAAKLVGVARSTFYELHRTGFLGPEPVRLGKCSMWSRSLLEDWVQAGCPVREEWLSREVEQGVRAMRVWKPRYRDKKTGKNRAVGKYWVEIRDHKDNVRRFEGTTDKNMTEEMGRKIERLAARRGAGEQPSVDLIRWLENIPDKLRDRLVETDLLDRPRAEASKSLCEHLDDFRRSLLAKGDTKQQANQVYNRAKSVVTGCKFTKWTNISASSVEQYLAERRNKGEGISAQTSNGYLQAIKQFCKWMVQDRRAVESPIEHLKGLNVKTDRRHDRRSLELDEIRRLLETTSAAPKRYGMDGVERYLLYRFAAETGLRANEIRNLKVRDVDFENLTVTVKAGYSKRRREDVQQLRPATAALLHKFFKGKLPNTKAFGGSTRKELTKRTSDMIKADLADAGIDYQDEAGRFADFHSLRHTTGSLLAASGAHPKVAQSILRHSDINLTLSRYSHVLQGQESEAIAKLPDLSLPVSKTGTDDADVTQNDLASHLAPKTEKTPKTRAITDTSGQKTDANRGSWSGEKTGIKGPKSPFLPRKRRGGDSNPRYGCIPVRRFSKPLP